MKRSLVRDPPHRRWARFAQLGFWFFLIKGLLWLLVPLLAAWLGYQGVS
ncbi:hypothetical protein SAMN04488120_103149 [Fontimonas thermophila]|uniref:Uncharacterized protein n=1 Tax=Fontimonas thermophila TaxID=1076937 RepID=A0A1I2IES2_9GAMM|nr:hypothetical protein [Fontimonas thermophila]SFF39041.1 hypothetical protein SAMN04488120_103149 [Fontimonas thermophila]